MIKLNDTKNAFAAKIERMKEELNRQRVLAEDVNEVIPNIQRSAESSKLRGESDAAWKKMAHFADSLRGREGYDNMESAMQKVAELCLLMAKCLSLELSVFSSQFFSEPNQRKTKSIAENPKSLQDFVKIGDDGKLDVSGLVKLAEQATDQDKENLKHVTSNWLTTMGYAAQADGSFKQDQRIALSNNRLKLLPESLETYLEQLSEANFDAGARPAAGP